MTIEILTIDEALEQIKKKFLGFKNPKRVFKNQLKKIGIKPVDNTITVNQFMEYITKCYRLEKEEKYTMSEERLKLAINRGKSSNTLADVIMNKKLKNNIADVSKYKAMEAFKILKKPILVEDGGLVIEALNGFPGPYTKYVLSTIGINGILKLMNGENNRAAKFVSFATFVGNDGTVCQFERFGDNFEIAYERKTVIHPDAWSDLWQVMYMKDYGKMLCEFSKQELSDFTERSQTSGSLQQFAKWFLEKY